MERPALPTEAVAGQIAAAHPQDALPRIVASRELLGDESSVLIAHGGALYTLRATRTGKLILTK